MTPKDRTIRDIRKKECYTYRDTIYQKQNSNPDNEASKCNSDVLKSKVQPCYNSSVSILVLEKATTRHLKEL